MVNEWTRDDLPTEDETEETYMAKGVYSVHEGIALVLDAVVDHLNAHYPKPSPEHVVVGGRLTISESQFKRERDVFAHRLENQSETIAEMQGVIRGLHRAHEIVEGERDQSREQWKKWEHKAGEWKARAEAAEARLADPLLDKAQEFAALADWELTDREAGLLHKVAAHVLGQEDRHDDQ